MRRKFIVKERHKRELERKKRKREAARRIERLVQKRLKVVGLMLDEFEASEEIRMKDLVLKRFVDTPREIEARSRSVLFRTF